MKGTYAVAAMVRNLQQAHTAFVRAGKHEKGRRGALDMQGSRKGLVGQ